jgi:predicted RND superfamily exporter protein
MEARLSFQSIWISNEEGNIAQEKITKYLTKIIEEKNGRFSAKGTGLANLYLKMEKNLFRSQIYSFIFSYITIFIFLFFVCRSFFLTFLAMLPNIFPFFVCLFIMGILRIPFDVATVMVGGVTMGIAVDDTVHYMVWFRRNMLNGMDHRDAIIKTFKDVGKPAFIVSITLCAGFLILVLGSISATKTFGALTAFTMAIAPFGDYLMLPSLTLLFKPKVKKSTRFRDVDNL